MVRAAIPALRSVWGAIEVDDESFARSVVPTLAEAADPAEALATLHLSDLYLAFGCGTGCARAHAELEQFFMRDVARYVRVVDSSAVFADEVKQALRDKLLLPSASGPPKILGYTGRGPLGGWLRVSAVRTARNLKRGGDGPRSSPLGEQELVIAADNTDPELAAIKARYGREFREAMEETLTSLSSRERAILRLSLLDGLSSEAIGKLYGVSGAAVRLWLKELRRVMLLETRKHLVGRIGANADELDELVGIVQSGFDLTLSRVLRDLPVPVE
jgi:RNA polymerase sigma-70 factor (ECF subfamily)